MNDINLKLNKWGLSMSKKTFSKFIACLTVMMVVVVSTNIVRAYSPDELKGMFNKKKRVTINFGSVNVADLRKNLEAYKQADASLKVIDEEYTTFAQRVMIEQNKATNELMQRYEGEKLTLSKEEALELLERYNEKASELAKEAQKKLDTKQAELDLKRAEIEKDARTKVRRIVREVARKEGIRYIIDKKSGLYIRHDITEKVIEAATKEENKKKKLFGIL